MDVTQSSNNSLLEGSFLSSKYFDPAYLFSKGYTFFQNLFSFSFSISNDVKNVFYFIVFLLATFFLFVISYCVVRLLEIRKKEHAHLEHELAEYARHQAERERRAQDGSYGGSNNPKWVKTLNYVFSNNSGDWKLAIIEADSILDDLLDQLGFKGESLGEKLKMANQENFRNLSTAWEVHTIRNRIAHEGSVFNLSQHEAKRIIALYEKIFRQYGHI